LELIFARVPRQSGSEGARDLGTNAVDRPGNSGEHASGSTGPTDEAITADDVLEANAFGAFIPIDPALGTIAVQVTRNEAATSIVRNRLINIVRAATVFITANILIVGSGYSFFYHEFSARQNVMLAISLIITHLGGMFTIWAMKQVQVEDIVNV
jgi:hypothetical protein